MLAFRRWQAKQQSVTTTEMSVPISAFKSNAEVRDVMETGASIHGMIDGSRRIGMEVPETLVWAWLREQLIARPEHVAQQTGIPEIARLADLPKRPAAPKLKDLGKLYKERNTAQKKQRRQGELFWGDFEGWMAQRGVKTVRELTAALVAEYGDHEHAAATAKRDAGMKGGSLTYLRHRFNYIRGVINFGRKRGLPADDSRHGLDCCAVLHAAKAKKHLAPHPISREDFHRLLDAAKDPRKKAVFLVMLNLCMYPSEALALDWGEIDLHKKTVVTDRNKTGVVRIGILWDETVVALKALRVSPCSRRSAAPNDPRSAVFVSREGNRWSDKTLNNQYRALRKAAGISDTVKCEDLRDGAYTEAIESGVELTQAQMLAGHTTGIPDHYVMRRPTMVAEAIRGIYQAYFG